MGPQEVDDITAYAGDPLDIKCVFANPDGSPIPLQASTITVTMRGGIEPTVDMADAANGNIYIRLTEDDTKNMLPLVTWDLFESPRWNRTLITGRLVKENQVS